MEIRLNCFNSVELNGFAKLKNIKLEIISYNFNNKLLSGDVKTTGEYFKLNDDSSKGFEDIVPFEVMFSDDNIEIKKLYIENELFTFKETVGIKMQYEIVVEYDIFNEKKDETIEDEFIEVPVEIEEVESVININEPINIQLNDEQDLIDNKDNLITKQFEIKLDNAMKSRDLQNDKVSFLKQKTSFKTITVYYLNHENQIESISKEKRVSINDLYKNNDDFSKTHRLIVNE